MSTFVPIVEAYTTRDGASCQFFCDYCIAWHSHGNGDGHRIAHCSVEGSPYKETGYEICVVGKLTGEIEKRLTQPRVHARCCFCQRPVRPKRPFTCVQCGRTETLGKPSAFSTWLFRQIHNLNEDLRILATDASEDAFWPKEATDIRVIWRYLQSLRASNEHKQALLNGWSTWLMLEERTRDFREFAVRQQNGTLGEWLEQGCDDKSVSSRSSISNRLRFEIFKRDNYRCTICGATSNDGARLEVDHIEPVAKGGTDDPENLHTLCFDCNRGKHITNII